MTAIYHVLITDHHILNIDEYFTNIITTYRYILNVLPKLPKVEVFIFQTDPLGHDLTFKQYSGPVLEMLQNIQHDYEAYMNYFELE
ncbi:MAG: hypothetical protein QW533_06885 [Thermoplasmata archaeon]